MAQTCGVKILIMEFKENHDGNGHENVAKQNKRFNEQQGLCARL